jgi:uncharacterized protein (TIGR01244 family)
MRIVSRLPFMLALAALLAFPAACVSTRQAAVADPPAATGTRAIDAIADTEAQTAAPALPSGTTLMTPRAGLYSSGQPGAEDWSVLAASGVRTVVNLRTADELQGRDERAEVEAAGLRYVEIPVAGAAGIDADKAAMLSALLSEADGKVLVHCASGNRVGGLLAVAMAQSGMSADQALAFGRSAGMKSTEARAREVIVERRAELCATGAAPETMQCAAP